MSDPLADQPESWPELDYRVLAAGAVDAFVEFELTSPSGEHLVRQYLKHPGSVAIIALDEAGRIPVVRQYRHAVGMRLVEPPAGLLDVPGEAPLAAAKRELAEEAGLGADDWRVLVDFCPSPGASQESARIFLATHLRRVPRPGGFQAHGEERDMGLAWVNLDDVLAAAYAGEISNPALVLGCVMLHHALLTGGLERLRPGAAPWPMRAVKETQDQRHR